MSDNSLASESMERPSLGTGDLRKVLGTLLRINTCRTPAALTRDGVQALLDLIPADTLCMQLLRANGEPVLTITDPDWPYTRSQVAFYRENSHQHPMIQYCLAHRFCAAVRMSDVIAMKDFLRHPIYVHCMQPHGLRFTLGIIIFSPGSAYQAAISFDRRDHDFTARECALLDVVAPHLGLLMHHLQLLTGRRRPWREPSTRDWLAGELLVSNREAEILLHLLEGSSDRDIAALLSLSRQTVKKHLQNAYRKLGVQTRHAAAALVRQRLS